MVKSEKVTDDNDDDQAKAAEAAERAAFCRGELDEDYFIYLFIFILNKI